MATPVPFPSAAEHDDQDDAVAAQPAPAAPPPARRPHASAPEPSTGASVSPSSIPGTSTSTAPSPPSSSGGKSTSSPSSPSPTVSAAPALRTGRAAGIVSASGSISSSSRNRSHSTHLSMLFPRSGVANDVVLEDTEEDTDAAAESGGSRGSPPTPQRHLRDRMPAWSSRSASWDRRGSRPSGPGSATESEVGATGPQSASAISADDLRRTPRSRGKRPASQPSAVPRPLRLSSDPSYYPPYQPSASSPVMYPPSPGLLPSSPGRPQAAHFQTYSQSQFQSLSHRRAHSSVSGASARLRSPLADPTRVSGATGTANSPAGTSRSAGGTHKWPFPAEWSSASPSQPPPSPRDGVLPHGATGSPLQRRRVVSGPSGPSTGSFPSSPATTGSGGISYHQQHSHVLYHPLPNGTGGHASGTTSHHTHSSTSVSSSWRGVPVPRHPVGSAPTAPSSPSSSTPTPRLGLGPTTGSFRRARTMSASSSMNSAAAAAAAGHGPYMPTTGTLRGSGAATSGARTRRSSWESALDAMLAPPHNSAHDTAAAQGSMGLGGAPSGTTAGASVRSPRRGWEWTGTGPTDGTWGASGSWGSFMDPPGSPRDHGPGTFSSMRGGGPRADRHYGYRRGAGGRGADDAGGGSAVTAGWALVHIMPGRIGRIASQLALAVPAGLAAVRPVLKASLVLTLGTAMAISVAGIMVLGYAASLWDDTAHVSRHVASHGQRAARTITHGSRGLLHGSKPVPDPQDHAERRDTALPGTDSYDRTRDGGRERYGKDDATTSSTPRTKQTHGESTGTTTAATTSTAASAEAALPAHDPDPGATSTTDASTAESTATTTAASTSISSGSSSGTESSPPSPTSSTAVGPDAHERSTGPGPGPGPGPGSGIEAESSRSWRQHVSLAAATTMPRHLRDLFAAPPAAAASSVPVQGTQGTQGTQESSLGAALGTRTDSPAESTTTSTATATGTGSGTGSTRRRRRKSPSVDMSSPKAKDIKAKASMKGKAAARLGASDYSPHDGPAGDYYRGITGSRRTSYRHDGRGREEAAAAVAASSTSSSSSMRVPTGSRPGGTAPPGTSYALMLGGVVLALLISVAIQATQLISSLRSALCRRRPSSASSDAASTATSATLGAARCPPLPTEAPQSPSRPPSAAASGAASLGLPVSPGAQASARRPRLARPPDRPDLYDTTCFDLP